MTIASALLLLLIAAILWRSSLRLPGAILAGCVLFTLGGDRSPEMRDLALADLSGGLSGDILLLVVVAVGFALCCGWRPGRRTSGK